VAGELTLLIRAASDGDEPALNRLVALLYVDLRRLAQRLQRGQSHTLDTTSLVHECYLRFLNSGRLALNDRAHFFNLAARVMRQLLCDYARERLAEKRGGGAAHFELRDDDAAEQAEANHCLAVDQALADLAEIEPTQARVVECRFFAGLTEQETAEALDRSLRSVQRDWQQARTWLSRRLKS
jgi:RNA polymerase sigma factor (TIGR02999 family)